MIRKIVRNPLLKIRISSPIMKIRKLICIVISSVFVSHRTPAQVIQPFETYGMFMSDSALDKAQLLSTGFVIDSNTIVGCYHTYRDSNKKPKFIHMMAGKTIRISMYDSFPDRDLVIYKSAFIVSKKPLQLRGSKNLKIGDSILYAGDNMMRKPHSFSKAIISKIDSIKIKYVYVKRITFNCPGNSGYIGGPIFDQNGKVIGIIEFVVREKGDQTTDNIAYSLDKLIGHNYNRRDSRYVSEKDINSKP
jgi:S1-C subfamily serine protease